MTAVNGCCAVCNKAFLRKKGSKGYHRKSLQAKTNQGSEILYVLEKILDKPISLDKTSNFVCELCFANIQSCQRKYNDWKKSETKFLSQLKPDSSVLCGASVISPPKKRKFMMSTPTTAGKSKSMKFISPMSSPKV